MEKATKFKAFFTVIFSFLSSILGVLAIPVILMVLSNIIDYITGLFASPYRNEDINSYKSIRGIIKKVCMWLLVVVGAMVDELIVYAVASFGFTMPFTFMVACVVAIWIVCNEIISILENLKDIGVKLPVFLLPLVKNIKSQVENKATITKEESK
jgi:toxin secretion/phage lysis holin